MCRQCQGRSVFHRNPAVNKAGFTLVEALVSITIISLAGSALLLATQISIDSSQESLDQTIAHGVANRLIDEILGLPYMEQGESHSDTPLGTEAGEDDSPAKRILYDDTDDYNGYLSSSLRDEWAIRLGQGDGRGGLRHPNFRLADDYFDRWEVLIQVSYADEADLAKSLQGTSSSDFRAIEIRVEKTLDDDTKRTMANIRRVYAYVPPSS